MANWLKITAALIVVAAILLSVSCVSRRMAMPIGCLALADTNAGAAAIRAAPPAPAEDRPLCEGLALLAERKAQPAIEQLQSAVKSAAKRDRWSVQGYLARALALDNQAELAFRNWDEAIEGATRAGHVDRQNLFRADRGLMFAIRKQYGPALADFDAVYRQTSYAGIRSEMAYMALKAAVGGKNLAAAEHWYPLTVQAAKAVGDAEKLAYATEFYGQMLDERKQFDASAKAYRDGVDSIQGFGSKFLHAELLEFQGQSRFAAGDYRGGERAYGQAAEMFRQAGRADYADFLERNLKAKMGAFENGSACSGLLSDGSYDAAVAAVNDIPKERRSFEARTCLVRALNRKGDTTRARMELDYLMAEAQSGSWRCDELHALAGQIGTAPATPLGTPETTGSGAPSKCG